METAEPAAGGGPASRGSGPEQDGRARPPGFGGTALGVAIVGYVLAFVVWQDALAGAAGVFCLPAALIAAGVYGRRVAVLAWLGAFLLNALLGAVLGGQGLSALWDGAFLFGHALLAPVLWVLGSQSDLRAALDRRERELLDARTALEEAQRSQAQSRVHARLSRADRMASVGTLAAGVAHEINNPLTYVIGNLYYALEELGGDGGPLTARPGGPDLRAELSELLRDALDGAERVRRIVRDLKTFSRVTDSDGEDEYMDVQGAVEASLSLVRNEIRHRARLSLDMQDVPALPGHESRLVQVLVNLLMNASQSIREGNAEAETITVRTRLSPAGQVLIEIEDTGSGMEREVQSRIFDPFFTTKPVGVGTGLGLSVTHGIVKSMKGEIRVESQPGVGSTFTVVLPVEASAAGESGPSVPSEYPLPARALRVLVVDDEPKVAVSLQRMLRAWEVSVCGDGHHALTKLAEDREFDAVLCDLMMPHVTGMDLFREVERLYPELARRFVFMTGGAFTPLAREFVASVDHTCLEKPFDVEAVQSAVARVVRQSAGRVGAGAA